MRKTNAMLVDENAKLQGKVDMLNSLDEKKRSDLSKVLGSYKNVASAYHHTSPNREVVVLTWFEIAGEIGELKADANYSMVIAGRDEFRNQVAQQKEYIQRLELKLGAYMRGEKPNNDEHERN